MYELKTSEDIEEDMVSIIDNKNIKFITIKANNDLNSRIFP